MVSDALFRALENSSFAAPLQNKYDFAVVIFFSLFFLPSSYRCSSAHTWSVGTCWTGADCHHGSHLQRFAESQDSDSLPDVYGACREIVFGGNDLSGQRYCFTIGTSSSMDVMR